MKVLHYFLGFPPYRSGGLTKFAYDLMCGQKDNGDKVIALWPGKINFFKNDKIRIKKKKNVNGIISFEIINPLPVPLDEGIGDVSEYTKKCDKKIYIEYLKKIKPDVIHIHTLMGLHKEFIEAALENNIKTIFTAHDYFGICPKVTLYNNGTPCIDDCNCKKCVECNYSALSLNKIKIMQSPIYRLLKNLKFVKFLRKKHRKNFFIKENTALKDETEKKYDEISIKEYQDLRKYYVEMLEKIDMIHFNSNLTKEIYLKYINPKKYKVLSITHKDISDNRNNEYVKSDKIRFTFLASTKPYKGFYLLKDVLDEIYKEKKYDFELNVYENVTEKSEYMIVYKDGFTQMDLCEIFSKTDILVAPSLWYETFGFTVLEALSYGVPVIVSTNVGAKDIMENFGIVVKANNRKDLKEKIENLDKDKIMQMKNNIQNNLMIKTWNEFCQEIKKLYEEIK